MQSGLFLMPLHNPKGDIGSQLREDRDCIRFIDGLGYDEVWVGEHYCSKTEPIPDPLQFMASLIPVTSRIKLGTAVINLPQHHPVQVAGNTALFDHLSEGRFLMGVGPGGLQSDMEMFRTRDIDRHAAMVESIKIIQMLWANDPPYVYKGQFWDISLEKAIDLEMGIGPVIKPLQKPFPPLVVSAMSPRSQTAHLAGLQGWGLISANFMPVGTAISHWEAYCEGASKSGLKPNRANWRLARSIVVTETDEESARYLAEPSNAMRWYYQYLHTSFSSKGLLPIFKKSPDVPDDDVAVDRLLADLVISGSPKTVLDRLISIVDEIGPFGCLLLAKSDWDDPILQKRSYRYMIEDVMPPLSRYVEDLSR